MKNLYQIKTLSKACDENFIDAGSYRITVLEPELIRVQWNPEEKFTELPSQQVWFRAFNKADFQKKQEKDILKIETSAAKIIINQKKNDIVSGLTVYLKPFETAVKSRNLSRLCRKGWHYGEKLESLKGTYRTLDTADGAIPLEEGIVSKDGLCILDDSRSYLIKEDGELISRQQVYGNKNSRDFYIFAYGHNYKKAVAALVKLTGGSPLLPRFALGNWWSRYHQYTQEEYLRLMDDFAGHKIPLSIAVIDMDWHLTKIPKEIGSGWTGFSWNKELFPNPEEFLSELHKRGLKTSLNIHPAEGIGRHETEYKNMAKELGWSEEKIQHENSIPFDFADFNFIQAYFKALHYPLEKQGVDFWWIDWQQGEKTKLEGLDPLWALNHYYFLDNQKNDGKALILSRYSGPGSQRYPVGFSGDSIISWKSLDFQPYFTATASNIGYGWWSHDIGGHMCGTYDEELQVRWVQFGVFSPVMRLHSSASPFNHKEPWNYNPTAEKIITEFLQLRHKLIPYLYSMNRRFEKENLPLISPMYYENPENQEAYEVLNEYYFGTELICAPVTSPADKNTKLGSTKVWLPEGKYADVFTGNVYSISAENAANTVNNSRTSGGKSFLMFRNLETFPVLLKEGGIVTLAGDNCLENGIKNPEKLIIYAMPGKNGSFELFEYDKITRFSLTQTGKNKAEFCVNCQTEEENAGKENKIRKLELHLLNTGKITNMDNICHNKVKHENIIKTEFDSSKGSLKIQLEWENSENAALEKCFALLDKMEIDYGTKEKIFDTVKENCSIRQAENAGSEKIREKLLQLKINPLLTAAVMEAVLNG